MGIHKHSGELGSVLIDTGEIMKFLFPYMYTLFRKPLLMLKLIASRPCIQQAQNHNMTWMTHNKVIMGA